MSEIINALKKVIAEFDPIHVSRYKAECILQVINKYYVKRTELAEIKAERDSWKENAYMAQTRADNVTVKMDRYRDALEDCRPHEHHDDCRWPCTCGKDKADKALEANDTQAT